MQRSFAGRGGGGGRTVRAKAEVETVSSSGGGEEVRRAGLSNNKGHRGKVRQVNLLLPVVVSVNL